MKILANIEFYNAPAGKVELRDCDGVRTYKEEDVEITNAMFSRVESDYPEAFKALCEKYKASRHNIPYFKYKVVLCFIRCNFGRYDNQDDIDSAGNFHFEYVACPQEGECPWYNIICNPKFNTKLSIRENEIMRLMVVNGLRVGEVAERLFLSIDTIRTHKRNAMQRVGVHSFSEFVDYAHRNKIFKED
ncbi:helix-turn-helix domain-containing protein [Butyricimonas paravirosa]|uniref:response regulator transcription factor n=1 Tax=Butyricimonas paravirosa TaxID=1472417 RepID=UPI002A7FCFB2|nr:helix-turn-helix domain-containing protein [Butyricimonas paravirosa]